MQPFDVCCPQCTAALRVSIAELIGRRVRCPQCRTPFMIVQPEQVGSGVLVGAGSSINGGNEYGWTPQEPSLSAGVLEEEPLETDEVLGGETAGEYGAAGDEGHAEGDAAEASYEAEAAADDDSVSVEPHSDYSSSSRHTSGHARRAAPGMDQQQMLMIGGAVMAGLVLVVTMFFLMGGSDKGSRRRTGGNKVERRDPRAFQDFAREAARQGW